MSSSTSFISLSQSTIGWEGAVINSSPMSSFPSSSVYNTPMTQEQVFEEMQTDEDSQHLSNTTSFETPLSAPPQVFGAPARRPRGLRMIHGVPPATPRTPTRSPPTEIYDSTPLRQPSPATTVEAPLPLRRSARLAARHALIAEAPVRRVSARLAAKAKASKSDKSQQQASQRKRGGSGRRL